MESGSDRQTARGGDGRWEVKQCYALVKFRDGSAKIIHIKADMHFYEREAKASLQKDYPDSAIRIYGIRSPLIANILEEYREGGGK